VGANVGKPQVAYRETITQKVAATGRFMRPGAVKPQFAEVTLEVEPLPKGGGLVFENRLSERVWPPSVIAAVEAGVREAMESGMLAGYPLVDVKAVLVHAASDEEGASEQAFKVAGSMAFREAVRKAGPVLLEPIMKVEVVTPDAFTGDVLSDLNARRAQIERMELRSDGMQVVRALVPLARMFGYATDLRSATQGRGTFTLEFDHYAPVSQEVLEKMLGGWVA
jgi:elongation factor G